MMKKRSNAFGLAIVIAAFTLWGFTFSLKSSAQGGGQQGQPQGDPPVEQRHPNVQVLKGLPESQLIPVMQYMSASLGVNCAFCHVNTNGKWEFEKDDKKNKQTARRMIQMTMDINKGNRDILGGAGVSCFTCHRGANDPVAIPQLPLPPAANEGGGGAPGGQKPAETLPSAAQVIDRYLRAVGGAAAADKIKSRVMRGTLVGADGKPTPFELHLQSPGKALAIIGDPKQGATMQALNGNTGWIKTPKEQRELRANEVARFRAASQIYDPIQLKEATDKMRVGRSKIGDRDVYVLTWPVDDAHIQRYFFDAQSGLLLRVITYTSTVLGRIPSQVDYDDYRDVDGVKLPFSVRLSSVDARSDATRKFTEIKANVPVDDAQFNPPPAPAATPAQK